MSRPLQRRLRSGARSRHGSGAERRPAGDLLGNPDQSCRSQGLNVGCARRLDDDSYDRGPALGGGEAAILIAALGPGDTEAIGRRAEHAGDVDRDLHLADLGKGVVRAGIVVERQRAAISRDQSLRGWTVRWM
jgi:hypothetical protein